MTSWTDLTLWQYTSYNPYAPGNWSEPIISQYANERSDTGSDVAGNTTDGYSTFTQLQYQSLADTYDGVDGTMSPWDGGVVSVNGTEDTPVNHGGSVGTSFDLWCDASCTP
jgi:hypothetical protein